MRFRRDKGVDPAKDEKERTDSSAIAPNQSKPSDEAKTNDDDANADADVDETQHPTGLRLGLLLLSVFVAMFLTALDRLIISTAIPSITDEFHSLQDVGWYGSAYLLTTCSFQLIFGKLFTFYPVRVVFIAAIFLFEVGSAICGAAPNSVAFIIGRAVQGVGSAGVFSGAIVSIVYAVPLRKRPLYQGMFGAVFGLASVIGPLLGGAFTSNVTWRWCFYINLPIGGVAMVIIGFLLEVPDRETTKLPWTAKLSQLDAAGTAALIPGVVCLLLALQWGGLTYAWNNARIIALLTLGGVLLVVFVIIQGLMPKTATVPGRVFKQRSILAAFWATVCIGSQMMIFVYFLPIWFQAIDGVSAVDSGIRLLPLTLSMVVASVLNGIVVSKIGYYTPPMLIGICLMCVGAGLLTTLQLDTGMAKWVGYQVLYGFGMGMSFQAANLAAQTVLPTKDVPVGTSLVFFSQLLGGAIFVSIGQNVLTNQLLERLSGLPGFQPSWLEGNGATELSSSLPPELREPVLVAYNEALREVFRVGLIMACLAILGAAAMEWRSVKKKQPGNDAEAGSEKGTAEKGGQDVDFGHATDSDDKTYTGTTVDMEKANPAVLSPSAEGTSMGSAAGGEPLPAKPAA